MPCSIKYLLSTTLYNYVSVLVRSKATRPSETGKSESKRHRSHPDRLMRLNTTAIPWFVLPFLLVLWPLEHFVNAVISPQEMKATSVYNKAKPRGNVDNQVLFLTFYQASSKQPFNLDEIISQLICKTTMVQHLQSSSHPLSPYPQTLEGGKRVNVVLKRLVLLSKSANLTKYASTSLYTVPRTKANHCMRVASTTDWRLNRMSFIWQQDRSDDKGCRRDESAEAKRGDEVHPSESKTVSSSRPHQPLSPTEMAGWTKVCNPNPLQATRGRLSHPSLLCKTFRGGGGSTDGS